MQSESSMILNNLIQFPKPSTSQVKSSVLTSTKNKGDIQPDKQEFCKVCKKYYKSLLNHLARSKTNCKAEYVNNESNPKNNLQKKI